MFISCPHCRELVALDRETRLAPAMCPRCGGAMNGNTVFKASVSEASALEASAADASATGERSFASFLQGGETATPAATGTEIEDTTEIPVEGTDADPVLPDGASGESLATGTVAETVDEATAGIEPGEIDTAQSDTIAAIAPVLAAASTSVGQALQATPSFTRQVARPGLHPRTAKWQWAMLTLLSLLLALQVLLADRARLAADAAWRPLVARLCGVLGCSIPPWHEPEAFSMLSRDVSPIAGKAGGLDVQATFRNDARWAQAWPVLLLSLSDADGRVLGSRAFTPREYLGAAATQAELAPGQSAQIALQLHEPNPDVVAFTFDFR